MSALLRWTGHPLADVGVATLCAMAAKDDPEALTLEDLDKAGEELKSAYTESVFVAYLSCVFPNSAYVNPTMKGESREKSMQRLLLPHRSPPDEGVEGVYCTFSGEPATHLLERSQMPMLTGAGVLNFFPSGMSELPVAGPYLLAMQALPLGGRRSEGKLLIVHCDDPQYTLQFVRKHLARNWKIIQMSRDGTLPAVNDSENVLDQELPGGMDREKKPKFPDAKGPESLVMDLLVKIVAARNSGPMRKTATSITVYHLSNSGQGPSLAIINIPGAFVEFLFTLHGAGYASKWQSLVDRAWREGKGSGRAGQVATDNPDATSRRAGKEKKPKTPGPRGPGKSRNNLYNDLVAIFVDGFCDWGAATRFIRRYLLPDYLKLGFDSQILKNPDPHLDYNNLADSGWELTSLFLNRMLAMDKERIEAIRLFANRLAEIIDSDDVNGKRLFRDLVFVEKESIYRTTLKRIQVKYAKASSNLAFSFDEYVTVFLMQGSEEKVYWSMIRDLISIAMVDALHLRGFFTRVQIEDEDENSSVSDDDVDFVHDEMVESE